ncbi:diguanylate cyclase/cyclic diguanylate phosphodiesterase [Klebsiella pneumoniae subsp. rhinoscleromatis]|nr:diguanylate cyclase/cyclic diguanylate phosphodiesterase [Klebsiella pneumoniae subsp. rhinoscleromatis]
MADIYARSDRNKRRWRSQAEEDPLTGLPNLRALESHFTELSSAGYLQPAY